MDRSLYPEGVEVHQSDLKNTEDTRSFHILQRHIDNVLPGVVSGLIVTPNSGNPTLIDVAPGYGYCPNGELVELENSVAAISLADYTTNIKNYILATYTETYDDLQPHETSGSSLSTKANRSVRLEVLSESQYTNLSIEDTNLDNTSYNRALVVAIVTAQGSGIDIITSNIELPSNFGGGVTATITGDDISGISIIRVDSNTITGVGTISYTYSTNELEWISPGDTSGIAIDISSGGVFELSSQPSNTTLTVLVEDTLLPTTNDSAIVSVTNIYTQNVPRHSSKDNQHRSFIGSGIPTTNNPHGLTPGDLGLGETNTEFHQEVFHSNGISPDSNSGFLEPIVNIGGIPHYIDFTQAISGDKLYLGGFLHTTINGPIIQFTDITDDAQILFNTYAVIGNVDNTATIEKHERVRFVSTPPPTLSSVGQLRDISENCPAGTAQIQWQLSGQQIRFKAPGDSGFGNWVYITTVVDYDIGIIRIWNETEEYWIELYAQDDTYWTFSDTTEDLLVTALPSVAELSNRLLISTTMFSGSGTGFLGNGFNPANYPNNPNDKRVFGLIDGINIKAGFDSFVSNGIWYGHSNNGQFTIGHQYINSHRKVCLALGENDIETIPLKIYPVDSLPTLEESDEGSIYYYRPAGALYLWNGSSWSTTS